MSTLQQLVEMPVGPGQEKPEPPKPTAVLRDGDSIVDVIPYNAYHDPKGGYFMHWLWQKLQADGLLRLYYPDVTDDEKFYPTFVRMMSSEMTKVLLVVLRNPQDATDVRDVVGFATWEPLKFGPAVVGHAGFIFLKAYWDRRVTVQAGERIMEWWFDRNPEPLDVAVGLIADKNTLANRFVQRLGWTQMGSLPGCQQWGGEQCDAVLWRYTRAEWGKREGDK